MSELVQVGLTNGRINPVIYRAHELTNTAWIFTNHIYQPSPWLLLHRQSMSDDDLDKLLVDRWGFSTDKMEMTLRRLYQHFRLDPDRVGTPYRDDAAPIRHAIRRGDLAAYSCPIEPLEKIHSPSHRVWSNRARFRDYEEGSLDYQRHKIVYQLGSVLKPRWDKFTSHNDLFYSESFANQQMIRVGAFMTGVGDSVASLFKALWDLGKLVVKVVGSTIKAVVEFHTNLTQLDIDAIMQGAKELGISIKGGIEGLKRLLQKAANLFNAVIGDSTVGDAVIYYLDGMMESMTHVSKFKLAGGATFTIGLEVLLFMVSGGAANAAKWGAQAGSKTAKTAQTVTKADFFGPFPVNALESMADFGRNRQKQITSGEPEIIPPIKTGDSKKATGAVAETKKPVPKPAPKAPPFKPKCFKPGKALKDSYGPDNQVKMEKDFYKQLKGQEDGINNMTVGEYLNNRAEVKRLTEKHGSWTKARNVMTNNGTVQSNARDELSEYIKESVIESLKNKNANLPKSQRLTAIEIREGAIKVSKEQIGTLDALHEQDLNAGGYDQIQAQYDSEGKMTKSGLGNKSVNRSLGSQWEKTGGGNGTRVEQMDTAAEERLKTHGPDAKMNIELKRCP